jgi:vWA-MoxR associated protein C-terminal domain/vWA-MoxR associated protein middle region (VMAP-M) 1
MRYETGDIKKLICKAFTLQDFNKVVFDSFRSVKEQFCDGQIQSQRQEMLAEWVIVHRELPLLLAAIEENNQSVYQEFKALDDLIQLLTYTDSKIIVDRAYRSSFPEINHRPIPENLATLVFQIADLPINADRIKPLDHFVNCLMQDRGLLDLQLYGYLCTWAMDRGIKIDPLEPIRSSLETYLKIEVRQHLSGKYLVGAAIVTDPDPHNFMAKITATTIDIPIAPDSKYAPGYSQTQLPEILNELLTICGGRYSIPLTDLNVQWFLPIELMSLPIEHWQIQTGKKQKHCNGIRCKSAIVRSVDREKDYPSVLGEWKKNWKSIPTCSQSLCSNTLKNLDPMAGATEIDLSKPNVVGCKFIEHEDPHEQQDFWDELFSQGLPIALWCRQSGADLAVMDDLSKCRLVNLPVSLTDHRKQVLPKLPEDLLPSQHNAHLSLLWDNPFRPFPTIDYQSY